jgi:hypothetical protein
VEGRWSYWWNIQEPGGKEDLMCIWYLQIQFFQLQLHQQVEEEQEEVCSWKRLLLMLLTRWIWRWRRVEHAPGTNKSRQEQEIQVVKVLSPPQGNIWWRRRSITILSGATVHPGSGGGGGAGNGINVAPAPVVNFIMVLSGWWSRTFLQFQVQFYNLCWWWRRRW